MNGSYLLDTNIAIAFLSREAGVKDRVEQADEILLPCIVVGELHFGARKSAKPRENLARIEELTGRVVVLDCDTETARQYGTIKYALRLKGRPIPENDIWIAAISIQYDLTLVTRDTHFAEVDGLKTESW